VSGELSERENGTRVLDRHVKMAQDKIEADSMVECISTLPTQSKAVLYAMLLLDQMGKKIFTSGEVVQVYRELAQVVDLDILTPRRITDLISELNMLGVITTRVVSRGRYGRTKEISIDANTRQIYDVISSDPRLKEESLMQLDINQLRGLFR
jgi:cell division control protein 6